MDELDYIWMDGEIIPWKEAKVHVLSHTLHYGDGVFEGIRFYETHDGRTAVFRLPEHIHRLFFSSKSLGMKVPYSENNLINASISLIKKNKIKDGYIRPLIFYGYGKMGLSPEGAKLSVCIALWPWPSYLGDELIKVKTSSYIRIHPKSSDTQAKICGHYTNSMLAHLEAKKDGYDEALMLDYEGNVAEGPVENIFCVKNGTLLTPPIDNILEGITRDSVIKIAKDKNIKLREKKIKLNELKKSDEAFFTGTASEITGIKQVDNDIIGDALKGPVTGMLEKLYKDTIHGKIETYSDWLTYV